MLLLPEARAAAVRSIAANGPGTVTLTRHAYFRLRPNAGGRGENALIRSLPFGRVRLLPWSDGRDPFRRGESLAHVLVWQTDSDWWTPYVGTLVLSKGTALRVMRTKPELELWAPDLPPIGHRWRKL